MDLVELLTVAVRFQFADRLLVLPDFSLPNGWKPRSEAVVVVTPDGQRHEVEASLLVMHLNIRDPAASVDKRWRLQVYFPTLAKEEVPIGSKVMVPPSLRAAILALNGSQISN
jgi:hypothetical protein